MGLVVDVRKNLRVCLNLTFIHRKGPWGDEKN